MEKALYSPALRGSSPIGKIPRRRAYRIRSAWVRRLSLRIKLARWVSTVRELIDNRSAIRIAVVPSATSCSISRSRVVSVS